MNELTSRISELYAAGQRVALRRYHGACSEEVATRLSPMVTDLLAGGRALVDEIVRRLSDPGKRITAPSRGRQGKLPEPAEIAAAAAQLHEHELRLQGHSSGSDVRAMIAECGVALRALQRSLEAIAQPVSQLENVDPRLPTSLEVALAVRSHYRLLWSLHSQIGEPSARTARSALRAVGTRIAILAGSDVFSLLREDDRATLRDLQARILEWLRGDDDYERALAIWAGFGQLVEVLRLVSRREDLLENDQRLMERAIAELATREEEALPEVLEVLPPVLGCDDALDEVVTSHPSARSLLHELRRALARTLGHRAPLVYAAASQTR